MKKRWNTFGAGTSAEMDEFKGKMIVFFDGGCGLCGRFVSFVFPRDRQRRLLYAPLQGETARRLLKKEDAGCLKSIILFKDGKAIKEARAIAEIMKILYPRGAKFLKILPMGFYNIFYRLIAKNRYLIMGKNPRLIPPAEQRRKEFFLS